MMTKALILPASVCLTTLLLRNTSIEAFVPYSTRTRNHGVQVAAMKNVEVDSGSSMSIGRRSFLESAAVSSGVWLVQPSLTSSMPSATTAEFQLLLQESAKSVQLVEFSGPKSETVVVRLVDGTAFGINDVVESAYDPRSPLKIAAMCRDNKVPTKFAGLEAILAGTPKKKKVYMNERVQEAAQKEKAKRERMARDEEERLAEMYRLEEEEAKRAMEEAETK